jgi:hypothetical protein
VTEIPDWASALGDEGPKPYETASWTYTTLTIEEDEPEEPVEPVWWETIGQSAVKPYETASWTYTVTEVVEEQSCEPSEFEDRDDLTCEPDSYWWKSIGGEGPKPYDAAAWTVTTLLVSEVDEAEGADSIVFETFSPTGEWWENLGGEGPKPYNAASWTFTVVTAFVREFLAVSKTVFRAFDETYFDRTSLGLILDSGYFGQVGSAIYDEAYFLGDERGVLVKRTISRLMVYDSKASSPGPLGSILQPIGNLGTDPEATVAEAVTDPDEDFIELTRITTSNDDIPPGVLLGSVSYETFDSVLTITDWEHLNWEDDAPVLMGVKTLLSQIPDGIVEVRVLDPPHAFWTSLGFEPDYKGDPYLHIHL